MKRFLFILTLALVALAGCKKDTPEPEPIVVIKLVGMPTTDFTVGRSVTISAVITPYDATDKSVTFTSSNPEVATVEYTESEYNCSLALLKAVGPGKATITATVNDGSGVKAEAEVEVTTIPYVTFTANAEQTLSYEGSDLQYSTDGTTFKHLSANTPITFGGPTILYLRGVNNLDGNFYVSEGYYTRGYRISFGNDDVPVACTGDIRTLIDYETYNTVDTSNAKFVSLFEGCKQLTSAPALPATTLADYCYASMFFDCEKLTEAPELPATTLAQECYSRMFRGCYSLVTAPELPATTLAQDCYLFMFSGCSSLVTAPELPATTLADGCYECMFYYCGSLKDAPELPATTLAANCYDGMFISCWSLKEAPALPATTLAYACYEDMFQNCSSLETAPALPATTLAQYCYNGMFEGCEKLTEAPALPATTLAEDCYLRMFCGCTSLEDAPALPATTLADYCYAFMFQNCTSLVNAPALPATTLAESCYQRMFDYCTSLVNAPALPATTLTNKCYGRMFGNCTSLVNAPELPATTLATHCYDHMFYECTSLNKITMLATDISATDCLNEWVKDVAATGTFTKAASMTTLPSGDSGIPTGWTVLDWYSDEYEGETYQSITITTSKAIGETIWMTVQGELAASEVEGAVIIDSKTYDDGHSGYRFELTSQTVTIKQASIEYIFFAGNQITSVDLNNCTDLRTLHCRTNEITGENMTDLVNSLPDRTGKTAGEFVVYATGDPNEKNEITKSDVAIAKAKNWNVLDWYYNEYEGI